MPRVDDYLLGRSLPFSLTSTGENRTDLTLTQSASPTGRIRGRVTSSVDDSPLGGVTVKVRTQSGDPVAHTETNSGGNYQINDIPPGTYTINVALHGFVTPAGQTFSILGGQTLDINFTMTPESRPLNVLYGIISNEVDGLPIAGAIAVFVTDPSSASDNIVVLSNASGQYLIGEIADGQYFLAVHCEGFITSDLIPVTINGDVITRVDVSLQPVPVPQATVNGYIKNQGGTPISGACVGLYLLEISGEEHLQQVTFTDSNGFYIFSRAVPGTYVVKSKLEMVVPVT